MPLNENEERILQEIERRFYAHDPDAASRIGSTSLPKYLARNCRWAVLGFIGGLVILLVAFASSWVLGVVGFLVMVVSTVVLIRNIHQIGRFGLQQFGAVMGTHNLSEVIDDAARRLRRRLGQDGDD